MIPPPPYLLGIRAARAMMSMGNIGPAKLLDMLDGGEAFFCHRELKDFETCKYCNGLAKSHDHLFLRDSPSDIGFQTDLASKLVQQGKLVRAQRMIAGDGLKFVSIAAREDLCCVVEPANLVWDNIAVCDAAKVKVVTIDEFLASF